ncbi:MAG: hypothetical protein F6J97_08475 [Leptolyngbya sp. SIO4C1]|nr:hypothetical protein [Leptolyngbya sp. SIO4C1]
MNHRPVSTLDADLSLWLRSPASSAGLSSASGAARSRGTPVVGQYFDQDFFGSSGEILNNFVESGQIWALLIGLVLGYLIRGLTTY